MLKRHIRTIHVEKNIKCDQCEYVTDSNNKLKIHVHVKHEVKTCNECEFSTTSLHKLKNHKKDWSGLGRSDWKGQDRL